MVTGGTIGKAKHQAFIKFLLAVYLLTGPMLLGIPAREREREREQLKLRHEINFKSTTATFLIETSSPFTPQLS